MKSHFALSPMLAWMLILTFCVAGAGIIAATSANRLAHLQTLPPVANIQRMDDLVQRVNALEQRAPNNGTTPADPNAQDRLDQQTQHDVLQKYILDSRTQRKGDRVTLTGLPYQNIASFSVPVSTWDEYRDHSYAAIDTGTTQLALEMPPVYTSRTNSNTFIMRVQRIGVATFIQEEDPESTLQSTPTIACETGLDYSLRLAIHHFQTSFPTEDWSNPCANIRVVDLKASQLSSGDTVRRPQAYVFFPKLNPSGKIPGTASPSYNTKLYATVLILTKMGVKADQSNVSEEGTLIEWSSFLKSDAQGDAPNEKDVALQLKKLGGLVETFLDSAIIPFCSAYGGCY